MLRDTNSVLFYLTVIICSILCIGYAHAQTDPYPVPDTDSSQEEPVLDAYPVPDTFVSVGGSPQSI